MTPKITPMAIPTIKTIVRRINSTLPSTSKTLKQGGVYSETLFDQTIQTFEDAQYSLIGRLTYQLNDQQTDPSDALLSPVQLFPKETWSGFTSLVFGPIYVFLEKLGQITSIITGVFVMYKLLRGVLEMCFISKVLKQTKEKFLWAFCPLMFIFRKFNSEATKGPA